MSRHVTDVGIDLVKVYEGFVDHVYICPAGYPTIGYGHLVRKGEVWPERISEEEATELLRKDIGHAELAVQRLIRVPLTDGQFDALVSFTFNLGSGALQRSTMRRKINRGEYIRGANELRRWVYAGGRKLRGLVRRREAERLVYLS